MIAHYQALRAAIIRLADARAVVLGALLTLVGTIVVPQALAVMTKAPTSERTLQVGLLVSFGALLATISGVLTGQYTRGIERIAAEIRDQIEPHFDGGDFESRTHVARGRPRADGIVLRAGASRAFAGTYALVAIFLGVLLIAGGDWRQWLAMTASVPLLVASMFFALDLTFRWRKVWVLPQPARRES